MRLILTTPFRFAPRFMDANELGQVLGHHPAGTFPMLAAMSNPSWSVRVFDPVVRPVGLWEFARAEQEADAIGSRCWASTPALNWDHRRPFDDNPGLSFVADGTRVHDRPRERVPARDLLPRPHREVMDLRPHQQFPHRGGLTASVETSRGWTNRCSFCVVFVGFASPRQDLFRAWRPRWCDFPLPPAFRPRKGTPDFFERHPRKGLLATGAFHHDIHIPSLPVGGRNTSAAFRPSTRHLRVIRPRQVFCRKAMKRRVIRHLNRLLMHEPVSSELHGRRDYWTLVNRMGRASSEVQDAIVRKYLDPRRMETWTAQAGRG